jgi:hypothetical protein
MKWLMAGFLIVVMAWMFGAGIIYHGASCLRTATGDGVWELKTALRIDYLYCHAKEGK